MTNKQKAIQKISEWLEQSNDTIAQLIHCQISCDNCPFPDKCTVGKKRGQSCEEFVMDLIETEENHEKG